MERPNVRVARFDTHKKVPMAKSAAKDLAVGAVSAGLGMALSARTRSCNSGEVQPFFAVRAVSFSRSVSSSIWHSSR